MRLSSGDGVRQWIQCRHVGRLVAQSQADGQLEEAPAAQPALARPRHDNPTVNHAGKKASRWAHYGGRATMGTIWKSDISPIADC